jgi:hypothetical protein
MGFLIAVGVILGLFVIIAYIDLCVQFSKIAEYKGHPKSDAFFTCLFLSIGGFLFVMALPDESQKSVAEKNENANKDELPECNENAKG